MLALTCNTDIGRARSSAAVDSLAAGGSTNIKAGLEMGVRVLDQRRHRNPVAGLILLSDGQDTDNHHPQGSYSYLLPSKTTVPIHTFGFGADHDPRAMHTIANSSGGTFSFIEAEKDVQDAFAMCIGGLLSVAAQKVELMVSSVGGVCISSVSSGSYSSRVLNHGLAAVVEFGDLYADEEKDILINVAVPAVGAQLAMQLLTVNCSYLEPLTQKVVHVDGESAVVRRPDVLLPEDAVVSLRVDRQRNRLLVGASIKEAQEMAERNDFEGAKAVLNSRRAELLATASAQAGDKLCGWLEVELAEIEKRMANMRVYEKSGRAYALAGMGAHLQQRAAAGATMNMANQYLDELDDDDDDNMGFCLFDNGSSAAVGYQTNAMREMVEKSKSYAAEEADENGQ